MGNGQETVGKQFGGPGTGRWAVSASIASQTGTRAVAELAGRAAAHGEDQLHAGIQEALAQDSLPDDAGRAEEDDFHPSVPFPLDLKVAHICIPVGL
jgi:hypothetical protein